MEIITKMYKIVYKNKVLKFLDKKVPTNLALQILDKIWKLKNFYESKNDLDIKKLKWYTNRYRLRVSKYRIIFEKQDDRLVILIIEIDTRGDVYKAL